MIDHPSSQPLPPFISAVEHPSSQPLPPFISAVGAPFISAVGHYHLSRGLTAEMRVQVDSQLDLTGEIKTLQQRFCSTTCAARYAASFRLRRGLASEVFTVAEQEDKNVKVIEHA
jgi:hypothetical protein